MVDDENIEPTFIDANVVANWIIVSSGLKVKGEISETEKKKLLKQLSKPIKSSYALLEKIRNEEVPKDTFYISNIIIAETFSVIGDEYRSRSLRDDGVPPRYWPKMINDVKITKNHLKQIQDEIENFFNIFLKSGKISENSIINLGDVAVFIFGSKCNTHDALILSQALKSSCKYFITEDQRLIKKLKKNDYKIKLFPSDKYLREIYKK